MENTRTAVARTTGALILGFLSIAVVSCTRVSAPKLNPQAGDDAGLDADERCSTPGALRCRSAARQREHCEDGRWTAAADCGEGEVCGAVEGGAAGGCLAVADVCRGSGGSMVCDGAGIMYRCSDSGVAESSSRCASARHCQLGLASGHCASCLPSTYRCQGDMLEACDAEGQRFVAAQACAAGACDAEGGLCRGDKCTQTRSRCSADLLEICETDSGEYREVERCGPGLCNAAANRCDACLPGARSCDGDDAIHCTSDGMTRERASCTSETPQCVGAGQCVQCSRDAECPAADACSSAYCELVQGVCQPQPRPVGTPCPDGVCDAAGSCVACLGDSDCATAPACQEARCDMASHTCDSRPLPEGSRCGTGVCDAKGNCAGCNSDDECPAALPCQTQRCERSSRTCRPGRAEDGAACSDAFGDGSCQAGSCVQCRVDGDCPAADDCEQAFCRSSDNTCQLRPAESGAACSGDQVCDGVGRCVECASDAQCPANAACQDNACQCRPGFQMNGARCELDPCAKFDDNGCGTAEGTGNRCTSMPGGYACSCGAGWQTGDDQCYQSGSGASARTVPNGAAWNVVPEFDIVCENAFDTNVQCPGGQLTWLNVCGLPDTKPEDCSAIVGKKDTPARVDLKRVSYDGPLQNYVDTSGSTSERVFLPAVGDVIVVQSSSTLYVLRITALSGESLTYEWANLWRDACGRPGGATCLASCGCPDGT